MKFTLTFTFIPWHNVDQDLEIMCVAGNLAYNKQNDILCHFPQQKIMVLMHCVYTDFIPTQICVGDFAVAKYLHILKIGVAISYTKTVSVLCDCSQKRPSVR